jgi:hypothetical protein
LAKGGGLTNAQIIRETLARHREQPSICLPLTFPISWQIDPDLGEMLSKDLHATGSAWEIRRATPGLWQSIPAKCGLYMFVYRSHLKLELDDSQKHQATWVLYVGRAGSPDSAGTLKDRYRSEYCKYIGGDPEQLWEIEPAIRRAANLKRYLSIWPTEYWFLVVNDRNVIAGLEDRLIKLFAPPLNKNGHLRLRKGQVEPAFRNR